MTTQPLLLALTAHAGAGKTTVAAYLEAEYAFHPIALADPLLDMLHSLSTHVDVDGAWLTEAGLKEERMPVLQASYRTLARTVADALRQLDPEFFVRIAVHKARQALEMGDNVVISDVRYPNEWAALQQLGAELVRIERTAGQLLDLAPHSSEAHTDGFAAAATLSNNASRATLFDQVDRLMALLRVEHS